MCRILKTNRSSFSYKSKKDDSSLEAALNKFAERHPGEGFWKAYFFMRNKGEPQTPVPGVVWVLNHLINKQQHGKPENLRMDNGLGFIAKF